MATTKDYLRLAILGGGSKGACISDTKVSISPDASAGQSSSYATTTAPFDGVVSFGLVATETNQNGAGPWFSVSGKNNRQNLNASWFQTGGSWSFIPCRKGEQITYGGSGVKFTVIDFYKSIGGGGKNPVAQLIWRIVPCLRRTLNRHWNLSSEVSLRGLVSKLEPLRLKPLLCHCNSAVPFKRIQPLLMGGCICEQLEICLLQRFNTLKRGLERWRRCLVRVIRASACTSKKDNLVCAPYKRYQVEPCLTTAVSSTHQSNLCLGGASHA